MAKRSGEQSGYEQTTDKPFKQNMEPKIMCESISWRAGLTGQ